MKKDEILVIIRDTRELISLGAMEGFNPLRGTWADRLFLNQAKLSSLIQKLEEPVGSAE